jgi:hypothetical protein
MISTRKVSVAKRITATAIIPRVKAISGVKRYP